MSKENEIVQEPHTIYVDQPTWKQLKTMEANMKKTNPGETVTMSLLVRRAILEYLAKHES